MSNKNKREPTSPLKGVPVEVVLLVLELLILWWKIPAGGLWSLSKKDLIIGVMLLSILVGAALYFYSGPVMRRGFGFVTLIGQAKLKNLAHRRKNPDQQSLWDASVSRGVSWVRRAREISNAVWTKARRIISTDESLTDQQTELPSAQSDEPNNNTTDE